MKQRTFFDILYDCPNSTQGIVDIKQAIKSGELRDELAKILPKEFYKELGYRKCKEVEVISLPEYYSSKEDSQLRAYFRVKDKDNSSHTRIFCIGDTIFVPDEE